MIVDMILDRKDGTPYNAKAFYDYCMEEQTVFGYYIGGEIATAMDIKRNEQVQAALCKYIMEQGYNPEICDYISEGVNRNGGSFPAVFYFLEWLAKPEKSLLYK